MDDEDASSRAVRAFDVRTVIGGLLGVYGVVTLVMGVVATSKDDLERAGGLNVNLLTGVALLVVAVGFLLWVRLRPLVVVGGAPAADEHGAPGG